MKTIFFEQIAGLAITGSLQVNIHQSESGIQTVSVLLSPKDPKLAAGRTLPPMLLKGSPQELDEAFFRLINEPVKQTEKLFANAEAYGKELDKAKKQVLADKDKKAVVSTAATPKAVDSNLFTPQPEEQPDDDDLEEPVEEQPDDSERLAEKQRFYEEAMQRVNTLNGQMKYAEALAQLPDPEEYPDKMEELKNKGEALLKRQELYASLQQEV